VTSADNSNEPAATKGAVPAKLGKPVETSRDTAGADYAERLRRLEGAWWKRVLNVQAPYRWNLRRLNLGRTLDVGCGIGRNLINLGPDSVGVDHNASSIEIARSRGLRAFTVEQFLSSEYAKPGAFDSMLVAHVVEHMPDADAREVVGMYLPYLKQGGRVLFITPQEKGYASDHTHVRFCGFAEVGALARDLGLSVEKQYSFPLPRWTGKAFTYNEFNVLTRKGE
jgi:SAM-dependent methyltransferase